MTITQMFRFPCLAEKRTMTYVDVAYSSIYYRFTIGISSPWYYYFIVFVVFAKIMSVVVSCVVWAPAVTLSVASTATADAVVRTAVAVVVIRG